MHGERQTWSVSVRGTGERLDREISEFTDIKTVRKLSENIKLSGNNNVDFTEKVRPVTSGVRRLWKLLLHGEKRRENELQPSV